VSPRSLRFFVAVALLATAVDLGAYLLLRQSFRWWAADIAALSAAAIIGISAHRRFTLRDDPNLRWIQRPTAFLSSSILAGLVDLAVLSAFERREVFAKSVAIAAAACVRAVSNRWFLFSVVRSEQGQPARRPPSGHDLRLSVIVPAYKEASRIEATIERLHSHLVRFVPAEDFELIVVDDGSNDGTADIAEATGMARGLGLPENLGKGGAVRAGMLAGRGRSRIFVDADLAYGPAEIVRIMSELEDGWDVVVGSRHDSRLVTQTGAGLVRDVGGRLVNLATMFLLLGQYRDTQAGIKGFRGDVAELIFATTKLNGFSFDIEIFHLVERWRLTLTEVPMTIAETETSTVRIFSDTAALFTDLGRIRRWSARGEYSEESLDELPLPAASHGHAGQ
jgi:dolichyl-phosphate beta-glucosyltransferase